MKVSEIMTREVTAVSPDTPLKDVATVLVERKISGVPVVDGDELLGVVSETDIVRKERGPLPQTTLLGRLIHADATETNGKLDARTAGEAMTSPPVTIEAWRSVAAAAALMTERRVNRLPVVEDGHLVGIVTRTDLVRAFTRSDDEIAHEIREDVIVRSFWAEPDVLALTVQDGAVTIQGEVETATIAEVLPRAIERVPGVVSVDADLTYRRAEEPARLAY